MNNGNIPSELAPYDMVIEDAVNKVAAGQNADHVLETLLHQLPSRLREAIRRRFQELLSAKQRGVTSPSSATPAQSQGRVAQIVFTLASAANLIAQNTFGKLQGLFRSRPDVASAIMKEAAILNRNGVTPDMVRVDDDNLGTIVSNVTKEQVKEREGVSR